MIKFTCDSCGKDISKKIHCSIRQFYPIDHFEERTPEGTGAGPAPEVVGTTRRQAHSVYLDVKLFDEFSRVIHAHAWDISSASILCSKCAVRNGRRKHGKVMTIFTKIEGVSRGESASADSHRLS